MDYKDKTIWVTGASSGIGEAIVYNYASKGANIILSARNEEKLKAVAQKVEEYGGKSFVAPLDLENSQSIKDTVAKVLASHPKVDILVNNGGISQRSFAIETPVTIDRKIMETNFFGAVTLTKEVLPALISGNGGHIIVISSVVGKFGFPLRTGYSASKHALQGYFEALRAELFDKKVKVTIVSPGRIVTNVSLNAIDKDGKKYGKMDEGQANGMTAEKCARQIVKAVEKNKKELLIGGKEVIMVYIRKYFPRLFHTMARKVKPT